MSAPTPWRTFSIFISSTFADMQAERDYLKQIVFPRVEEELQKRRIKLEIVDLRWGVDTTSMKQESEREANVLKVCLEEIKRCRPFFIGLLGDRYGWVPPEERIRNAVVGEDLILSQKSQSVTALEIEFGVLAGKEQLSRSVFYFRESLLYEKFSPERASMFSDTYNPALSKTEKHERETDLKNLKTSIKEHFEKKKLSNKVKTYRGTWDETKEKVTNLEAWGEIVYDDILGECRSHAEATWDKVPQNWQEQELALLDGFIEHHTSTFCGRKELLDEIKRHLLSNEKDNWGMVLTGESGSGKSAVFSMVKKAMDQENCFVLAHSAGLSPKAKNVLDILQVWNRQLSRYLGIKEESAGSPEGVENLELNPEGIKQEVTEPEIEKIQDQFRELLFTVAEQRQVVLLVDALDRFEPTERARYMTWLPTVMPGNIRLLCTAIAGTEEKAINYHNGLNVKSIDFFTDREASEMLDVLCKRQHKSLPGKVEKIILEKVGIDGQLATSSPLWLSLGVNMLMALEHDDFEKIRRLEGRGDQQIETYMADMAQAFDSLPGPLFINLVTKAGTLFGEDFTRSVFNYLACSRNGLREKDLEKILHTENIDWDSLRYANLRRWFKNHLVLQGEELQWNLGHTILRESLAQHAGEIQSKNSHDDIATYLLTLVSDTLKSTETLYHLLQAGKLREAAAYYGGELTAEEATGATTVLAETITIDDKGIEMASSLPSIVVNQHRIFHGLLKRYIYDLNDFLSLEGNLDKRLNILEVLGNALENTYGTVLPDENFGYDKAALNGKLGAIYQALGQFDQALEYFNNFNKLFKELYESNPKNESLKNGLAISYSKLGEIYQALGNFDQALEYFNNFNKLFKELYESNPKNESLKNELAISYSKLGEIYQALGNLDQALEYFNKYSNLNNELYENNPQSESLKNELAISYEKLGEIYQALGQSDQALEYFKLSSGLGKELYESNPKNENLKNGLAISYGNLGEIYQALGNFDQTLEYLNKAVLLFKELYESNPKNENQINGLATTYSHLGDIYHALGNFDQALEYFSNHNKLSKELYESNPKTERLKHGLAISYSRLGVIYRALGNFDQALEYFNKYKQLSEELHESNPKNEGLKNGLAISYEKLGEIYQVLGNFDQALEYFNKYKQLSEELYESNPKNENLKNGLAISYSRLGEIYQALGNFDQALEYFNNFNKLIKELYESNPKNENQINGLAISYEKLGEIYQALGNFDQALEYFNKYKQLSEELYENNPQSESLKKGLSISYEKLGDLYQALGNFDQALEYFKLRSDLGKELYESNPQNVQLLEGLGISYYKLAMVYKQTGNNHPGKENFAQWKNIISHLVTNMPQVSKYQEWDDVEYD